ncbi:methyltransferase domain-containing protein [Mesorhizobium sp. B2-6-2]|uniref:methyltransferase domain-containing protein n=1 Tax=Mesorhizobium sp. B2-6-2 TaxID=2589915 RepID=UPI0011296026|nr:methyltransferase domain-containing protein [Mesorhizobium sp. B2-6-2]TPJ80187.1 methyltransferase domain-containing protein [Mesorhizobium sp. B2-6-2]
MKKSFDDLYKAFEDRFRGSRELIKERLKIYQPLLAQVPRPAEGQTLAVDLGCGRGEWLEVLAEAGLDAVGVDVNDGMAQEAIERGLKIERQDAIEYLKGLPDDSAALVSAFHMVEHVSTDYLINLLNECHRVMADDGLLILETPNPENISVGTHTFYLDPTHKSPLPPSLLEFLVEQAGFPETAILRLNGEPMIQAGPIERSIHLMFEVARDYACLARKRQAEAVDGPKSLATFVQTTSQQVPADMLKIKSWLHSTDDEIAKISKEVKGTVSSTAQQLQQLNDNLSAQLELLRAGNSALTETVASLGGQLADVVKDRAVAKRDAEINRLQQHIAETDIATQRQFADKQAAIEERDVEIARLNSGALNKADDMANLRHALSIEKSRTHEWWLKSTELQGRIEELHRSRSWKLMGPYRRTGRLLKRVVAIFDLRNGIKRKRDAATIFSIRYVLLRPWLKEFISNRLRRYPFIFNKLRDFTIAKFPPDAGLRNNYQESSNFRRSNPHSIEREGHIDPPITTSSEVSRILLDMKNSARKREL